MRAPRGNPLTLVQKDELAARFRDIAEDSEVSVSVTYRIPASGAFDVQTGTRAGTVSDTTLSATRQTVTDEEIDRSGGTLQRGDRKYLALVADVPSGGPNTQHRIVDTDTYGIIDWHQDLLGLFYAIYARRV